MVKSSMINCLLLNLKPKSWYSFSNTDCDELILILMADARYS